MGILQVQKLQQGGGETTGASSFSCITLNAAVPPQIRGQSPEKEKSAGDTPPAREMLERDAAGVLTQGLRSIQGDVAMAAEMILELSEVL